MISVISSLYKPPVLWRNFAVVLVFEKAVIRSAIK